MTDSQNSSQASEPSGTLSSLQARVFFLTWLSYASYYLTRKNFSVTKAKLLEEDFGLTTMDLGTIDSVDHTTADPSSGDFVLEPGLVIAVEPMVNAGSRKVKTLNDGWTVCTADSKLCAHFEHTVAITENGPEILTPVRDLSEVC